MIHAIAVSIVVVAVVSIAGGFAIFLLKLILQFLWWLIKTIFKL